MKTRLEDVANEAGVSVATVSRVVNGKEGVSDKTREAVLSAVESLGYDRPARARRSRTGLVGIIVPELDNPIFPLFVQHIESALAANGYTPLLCTASPVVQEHEYSDMLLGHGVAGIVFIAGRHANTDVDHSRYAELRAANVPIVLINGYVDDVEAPFISNDDANAMRTAVDHLCSLGHRRIGCVMGPARYVPSQRKVGGFLQALAASIDDANGSDDAASDAVSHAIYSVEGGQAAAQVQLDRGVTAIVCGSDLMALGVIREVRTRGLDVPHDVSVVGFDDSPLMAFCDPPLTTMRQDVAGMSKHAVDMLLDDINGIVHSRRELLFPAELVVRGSTGPARDSTPGTR